MGPRTLLKDGEEAVITHGAVKIATERGGLRTAQKEESTSVASLSDRASSSSLVRLHTHVDRVCVICILRSASSGA